MVEPVIVSFEPPAPRFKLPHLPSMSPRATKLTTVAIAIVTTLSMVSFVAFSVLTNNKSFREKHNITNPSIPSQSSGNSKSDAALPGGGVAVGVGGTTGTDSPKVTLTADPASVTTGHSSTLKWQVTNNPKECIASEDWSGSKSSSGSESTPVLNTVQTYLFTLTCKNNTGTGFATVSVGATSQGGSGGSSRPTVTLAANPTSIYAGDSSTLTWSVTNNPTSCTASGDWSGAKSVTGPASTGTLSVAKSYKYTLTCANSAGTGYASVTVSVVNPPPDLPVVFLSSNPVGPVTPGSSVTLSWSIVGGTPSSCTASGDWSGAKSVNGGSQNSGALGTIKTYSFDLSCSNSTGSTNDTAFIQVLPNPPSISLTVSPSSILVGNNATINWSSTNSPTSCTASGDWSGAKAGSGAQSTGTLNTAKTYLYSLSCTNAGGSGFVNNVPLAVSLPSAPVVTISSNPITVTTGGSATITWSTTNSPTSCTASGDWSGAKAGSGTFNTGALNTVKTYTYTLNCSNAGGSGNGSTTVDVSSGAPPASAPVVTVSVNPTSIGTGSSSTISWSATNSPTSCTASGSWSGAKSASGSSSSGIINSAGSYTYTLNCSNSAGSDTKSAVLTVIAVPVITISLSPTTITTGSSSTVTWSVTNSPTSCTAGGSWSGSKAASGSQSTGTMSTAGTFVFSMSCTNAGGTTSSQTTLTVDNPAPVYCGGLTTCYGVSEMATHASPGNCWGWNTGSGSTYPWVIDITSFRPNHPGGTSAGSLEQASTTCNHDVHNILSGTSGIPSFRDKNGSTTFNHSSATKNNSGGSGVTSYKKGYYDAAKP